MTSRFNREPSASPRKESEYTLRTGGRLGPRREVPVLDAWKRLYTGEKRQQTLQQMFSAEAMGAGSVFVLVGPPNSGKSGVALAACDLRGYRAAYATAQADLPALKPQEGMCVIIDPVSGFEPRDVIACLNAYRGTSPLILIDRYPAALQGIIDMNDSTVRMWEMNLPSAKAISDYLQDLLSDYSEQVALDSSSLGQVAQQLVGLSYPQVNQVAVEAALSRLQHDMPIDASAFVEALGVFRSLQTEEAR